MNEVGKTLEEIQAAPEWQIQECYFGNSIDPSGATYRTDGERVQMRTQMPLEVRDFQGKIVSPDLDEVEDFLAKSSEWEFCEREDIPRGEAFRAYIAGWRELTAEDDLQQYLKDVRGRALL